MVRWTDKLPEPEPWVLGLLGSTLRLKILLEVTLGTGKRFVYACKPIIISSPPLFLIGPLHDDLVGVRNGKTNLKKKI